MKTSIAMLVSALAPTVLLTSCIVETGGTPGNPSRPPAPGHDSNQRAAYGRGYTGGLNDSRQGRPSNASQYLGGYDFAGKLKFIEGYNKGYADAGQSQGSGGMLTAEVGQGQVTVMQGGRAISTLRTAAPNVESQHFTAGQQQIVIKSRGNHGAANVELFDVKTGILRDKVLAYAIQNGKPAWARGMEE